MKKAIGSVLCILAIIRIASMIVLPQKPETTAERVQDGALVAVLLTIGIALSAAKPKSDSDKK